MKIYFSLNDLSLKLFPNLNIDSFIEDLKTEIINYFLLLKILIELWWQDEWNDVIFIVLILKQELL